MQLITDFIFLRSRFWTGQKVLKASHFNETVLNKSYGDVDVPLLKQIEVWYGGIKKEMVFVINGKNQGKATNINAKVLYGYISATAKGNMRVSMVPTEGEMLLMFEYRDRSLYSLRVIVCKYQAFSNSAGHATSSIFLKLCMQPYFRSSFSKLTFLTCKSFSYHGNGNAPFSRLRRAVSACILTNLTRCFSNRVRSKGNQIILPPRRTL